MSLRDPFDHGKPQAGTLPFPGASGGIYLIKTVPYFIQLILFNADSVIGNRAGNVSAAGGKGNERMAVLASIGDAVGNQVDEKAHQHGFISAKQDIGLDIGFQRDVSCSSKAALFFRYDFRPACSGSGISGWSCCFPPSARARVRSWEIRLDILRAWSRYGPDAASGFQGWYLPGSIFALGEDDGYGVRSSWETSEVNCFSFSKEAWSLSIIRSKVWAILWTSSFPSPTLYPSGEVVPFADPAGQSQSCRPGARVLRMIR